MVDKYRFTKSRNLVTPELQMKVKTVNIVRLKSPKALMLCHLMNTVYFFFLSDNCSVLNSAIVGRGICSSIAIV